MRESNEIFPLEETQWKIKNPAASREAKRRGRNREEADRLAKFDDKDKADHPRAVLDSLPNRTFFSVLP
jgi:hypothetical protein